jgi:hypothetical protein
VCAHTHTHTHTHTQDLTSISEDIMMEGSAVSLGARFRGLHGPPKVWLCRVVLLLGALVLYLSIVSAEYRGLTCEPWGLNTKCLAPDIEQQLAVAEYKSLYEAQYLVHCHQNNTMDDLCSRYWLGRRNVYGVPIKSHYTRLALKPNHSIHLMDKPLPPDAKKEKKRALLLDVVIDARCHHSWPYNPFHRMADCLVFILPALYTYFKTVLGARPYEGTRTRLALIVDESTEMLCEHMNKKTAFDGSSVAVDPEDFCLLEDFQSMLRSEFYYQCVKVSLFKTSLYWYKYFSELSVHSKQFIWLGAQKNPFSPGSGFLNTVHPIYEDYLKQFRSIMLNGFCKYCTLRSNSPLVPLIMPQTEFGVNAPHHVIILVERTAGTGRDIPQNNMLLLALRENIERINQISDVPYRLVRYRGDQESLCQTIGLFFAAKIIIAAHGAGIVNTLFSRPNTLLIEITPDKLAPDPPGIPWRMNAFYANYMGISSHVVVVPHNPSAKSDAEIQKMYSLDIRPDHIDRINGIMNDYLLNEYFAQQTQQVKNISVML